MRTFRILILLLIGFIFSQKGNAQSLNELLETVSNQEAFWAITVRDEQGNKIENYNSSKLIIPASNQKLFTLAATLDRLGSDFTFTTNIYGNGQLVNYTWKGDLIIKGSGDPSISGFLYNDDREFVFKSFLNQLKELGISEIEGNIYGDVSYFDEDVYPPGWDWYDLSFYYGVEIAPLSFNNNAFDLIVDAKGEIGTKPSISYYPELPSLNIINNQEIVTSDRKYDEYYRRRLGHNTIELASKLPQNYIETEALSIDNAGQFFVDSFKFFLSKNGINVHGNSSSNYTCKQEDCFNVLASHTSKPLADLVYWANKESDNFYTEMLIKTLAAEMHGKPGSFDNGILEVRSFLAEQGIDTNYVKMNDGSGLAAGNFTSTGAISKLLIAMQKHPEKNTFIGSLPLAGIDGSLAYRFKGTKLYNNVRAKTGYVGGARTLSGYLTAKSGRTITFSIATNHFIGKLRPIDNSHQQILEYLYAKY